MVEWTRPFELTGKTALVTGSTRGIGKAIARTLGQAGAELFVHGSRPSEALETTVAQFKDLGIAVRGCVADISDSRANQRLVEEIGQVDILVLNASVQYKTKWTDIGTQEFDSQIATNLRSTLELIQGFAPGMLQRKWGRILAIGSVNQDKQHPDMLVYAATKSAVLNMCRNLAKQFARSGVTVNNLAPGVIDTDRNTEALSDEAYRSKVLDAIPSGIIGSPEDCAGLALTLCSEAGRYITGQNVFVDGGLTL
ncbi:MAG: short-chain dehydrogenase [Lentisphaerae bacterium RIFOXYB12_FULL_65_16]|nr:MAG: short-chain dehydrogenase [Lentisphaerae bacterium RIFOXYA12_64_32]OGV87670.1 MAG: short-chain dehydrogenase [Lentisphaerae bacterium RIFOXYB12_FULL_65_16]